MVLRACSGNGRDSVAICEIHRRSCKSAITRKLRGRALELSENFLRLGVLELRLELVAIVKLGDERWSIKC